ncbi:hypothetical protein SDC9_171521 [bioreactor metagenome]|uniref:Uncharacterized protein n=1 Tax=bioreactor metagenome TaxID=1076179 RepID=A0A645GB37_9ZZZZ
MDATSVHLLLNSVKSCSSFNPPQDADSKAKRGRLIEMLSMLPLPTGPIEPKRSFTTRVLHPMIDSLFGSMLQLVSLSHRMYVGIIFFELQRSALSRRYLPGSPRSWFIPFLTRNTILGLITYAEDFEKDSITLSHTNLDRLSSANPIFNVT